ncbi:hypothetical protein NWFMUON74_70030 [Nocardia wallacei]|uniref:Uncharacterized protein n=1 Tax=Nocardia wallacei TaxID=480035 RepID=A0A7G1KWI5_9NOCA|nr:hypothetical protein NWFMUON74_70030 [Nocardia wallacei]
MSTETSTAPADSGALRGAPAYLPGIALLIAVGLLGKYTQTWVNNLVHDHHWRFPDIEYVLWAIVFGLIIANTVGVHRIFKPGIGTYEFWLKVGIVTLGSRFCSVTSRNSVAPASC